MEKQLYELKVDPAFANLIPPLQESELSMLTESILANGCEMPLVVWNGVIVDGHNRYRVCHENGVPFAIEEKEFDSREAAEVWIVRNQLGRRNLSDFQRCELVLPLEERLKAEAQKRVFLGKKQLTDPLPNLAGGQGYTRSVLAAMAGVSHGNLDKAKKIMGVRRRRNEGPSPTRRAVDPPRLYRAGTGKTASGGGHRRACRRKHGVQIAADKAYL